MQRRFNFATICEANAEKCIPNECGGKTMGQHKHILLKAADGEYYCPMCKGEFRDHYVYPKLTWIIGTPLLIVAAWVFSHTTPYSGQDVGKVNIPIMIFALLFLATMWIAMCREKEIVRVRKEEN